MTEIPSSQPAVVIKPIVILGYPKIDHEKDYVYYWMPFSTMALAKAILDAGSAEVVLFDGNQATPGDWERLLDTYLGRSACVGLSVMTGGGQIAHALRMAEAVRQRADTPILFGGPHVNVLPEQTLEHPFVDAVLVGPGQLSIVPYLEALLGRRSFETVPGLLAKRKRIIRGPENSTRVHDLSGYPWHLVDIERYVRDDPTVSPRTLNYVSSQGCVYKCQFCYELTYQRKYSKIASSVLLDEINDMAHRFSVTGIKFYDADWFVDLKRADAFTRGLIARRVDIRWAASINPNDILRARRSHPGLMQRVAESGCTRLLMGVESGSNRVLDEIVRKEITREAILDVAHEIADAGIIGSYTFIVGFPGETADEQEETFRLIEDMWTLSPAPETRVHLFAPYPGTPLFDRALEFGFRPPARFEDWACYDYYESQTPWTDANLAAKARRYTKMRLAPLGARGIAAVV